MTPEPFSFLPTCSYHPHRSTVLLLEVLASQDLVGKPFALILNKADLFSDGLEGLSVYESRVHTIDILREREELELREDAGNCCKSDLRTVRIVGSSLDMSIANELSYWVTAVASL